MNTIMTGKSHTFFGLLVFATILSSCSGDNNEPPRAFEGSYTYQKPQSDSDWGTSHVSEVGLDSAAFETMMNRQDLEGINVHSILIVKDGALVFEEYFSGEDSNGVEIDFDKDTVHELFSVTKSISSLLMGIALDNGDIDNLEEPLSAYMPDHADYFLDPLKADITLYDVLTMQGGIEVTELGVGRETSPLFSLIDYEDPLDYTLSQTAVAEPGTVFEYSTGLSTLLSEVIETATGSSVDSFAQAHLFTPLNIDQALWQRHESGHIFTGTGLKLLPRDMAKIGQLLLDNGAWNNNAVITEEWISESTFPQVVFRPSYPFFEYGYYWWLREFRVDENSTVSVVFAGGYGGQNIYIIPELDTVVVFTAGNFNPEGGQVPQRIMEEDIVPNLVAP